MIFDKYLNPTYLNIFYANYDENYLLSIDEDNFKDVYMLLKEESFYFIDDIILNYLELFQIDVEYVRKALTELKEIIGDVSIKLMLHNNNTEGIKNPCNNIFTISTFEIHLENSPAFIGLSTFNENSDDNAYIGFMYGTAGSSDYAATHANINKSKVLTNLETWYKNNLVSYEDKLADTIWCNDKNTFITYTSGSTWGYRTQIWY